MRQAHLCHSAVPSASCAVRVARGTSGTVRRRRPARLAGACGALVALSGGGGWRLGRASGTVTALLPDAHRPEPVSLLGCALACQDAQTCARPTCAIQRSQPASCAGRVARGTSGTVRRWPARLTGACGALVALSGGDGWRLGRASGTVRPCSQTPTALSLCPSWDAPSLARTTKLAPDPPVPFSGPVASCAGRVARGTSGTVRRRRPARLAGACGALVALSGGDGWRLGRASGTVTALLPDACRPEPVSLLGCALACQDAQTCARPTCAIQRFQPASCAGRVARGTSGTVRRRRPARLAGACGALVALSGGGDGWRLGRASGSTALLSDACRPEPVSLLGCALACQDGQTCARPTCAIQRSHPHRAPSVLRVALVALSGGGDLHAWPARAEH